MNKNKLFRRNILKLAGAVLAVLVLSACGVRATATALPSLTLTLIPEPATFVSFVPDNSATISSETLSLAQKILQERLDTTLSSKSEVQVENNALRVGLSDKKDLPTATELATKVGVLVFFQSDKPIAIGESIPSNAMVIITDADIDSANISLEPTTETWIVDITLTPEGKRKLAEYTQAHVGDYVIIARENKVISAPKVNSAITGGEVTIVGEFDKVTAEIFAAQLNSGRLPVQLVVVK